MWNRTKSACLTVREEERVSFFHEYKLNSELLLREYEKTVRNGVETKKKNRGTEVAFGRGITTYFIKLFLPISRTILFIREIPSLFTIV